MKFTMTIDMDNDAFGQYPESELGEILEKTARKIIRQGAHVGDWDLFDTNGNRVGCFEIECD